MLDSGHLLEFNRVICVASCLLVLILEFCFDGLTFLEAAWPKGRDIDGLAFAIQQKLCHDQSNRRRNFEAHTRKSGCEVEASHSPEPAEQRSVIRADVVHPCNSAHNISILELGNALRSNVEDLLQPICGWAPREIVRVYAFLSEKIANQRFILGIRSKI